MAHLVRTRVSQLKPDLIFVHLFRMAPYALGFNVPVLVDLTDVISFEIEQSLAHTPIHKRALYFLEGKRIRDFEDHLAGNADALLLCSRRDAYLLQKRVPGAPLFLVPTPVDVVSFESAGVVRSPHLIVFTGRLDCRHNELGVLRFAERIFPLVRRRLPQAHFALVGMCPSPRIRAMLRREGFPLYSPEGDVEYARALQRATVSVAPLPFSAGTQGKILDSMAAGAAVVTVEVCSEGIGAVPGEHLLVADSDEAFAEAVVNVLHDRALREHLTSNALRFVREHYSFEAAAQSLERAIAYALAPARRAR